MWSPMGEQKQQKVVVDRNPYPILEGPSKTANSEVRRNPRKTPLFDKQ